MKITHVAPGSKFEIDDKSYELCTIPNDGGYQWKGEDGEYKLSQPFYFHETPTTEQVVGMIKHLIA